VAARLTRATPPLNVDVLDARVNTQRFQELLTGVPSPRLEQELLPGVRGYRQADLLEHEHPVVGGAWRGHHEIPHRCTTEGGVTVEEAGGAGHLDARDHLVRTARAMFRQIAGVPGDLLGNGLPNAR
jgi:hypothetical protein